nr:hypothetical protein Iba_chr02bCG19140 [Ipomoea batatas]
MILDTQPSCSQTANLPLKVHFASASTSARWSVAASPPPQVFASASTLLLLPPLQDGQSPPRLRHRSSPLPPLCFCFHLYQMAGRRLASATSLCLAAAATTAQIAFFLRHRYGVRSIKPFFFVVHRPKRSRERPEMKLASAVLWKRGHVAVGLRVFRGSGGGSVKEAVIGDLFQDLLKIGEEEVGGGGTLYDRDGGGAL